MYYLIDGFNLIHAIREQGLGPAPARDALCAMVAEWAQRNGVQATIVFDGSPPRGGLAKSVRSGCGVRFSGPQSADAVIAGAVAESAAPAEIMVVTTDRALQHEVRYHRASTIESEQFAALLFGEPSTDHPQRAKSETEKPDAVSSDEVEEWLERFDGGGEPAPW